MGGIFLLAQSSACVGLLVTFLYSIACIELLRSDWQTEFKPELDIMLWHVLLTDFGCGPNVSLNDLDLVICHGYVKVHPGISQFY